MGEARSPSRAHSENECAPPFSLKEHIQKHIPIFPVHPCAHAYKPAFKRRGPDRGSPISWGMCPLFTLVLLHVLRFFHKKAHSESRSDRPYSSLRHGAVINLERTPATGLRVVIVNLSVVDQSTEGGVDFSVVSPHPFANLGLGHGLVLRDKRPDP